MAEVDIDTLTMEQYLALTRENQAPGMWSIPGMPPSQALEIIQTLADHSQKWHDGSRRISSSISDGIVAITNKLDSLGRDMKKLNENGHAIQVEQLTKDYQAKTAKKAPNLSASIGQCKAIFAENGTSRDETSSNGTNELHEVSFIFDNDVHVSKKVQFGGRKGKRMMVESGMAALRLFEGRKGKTMMVESGTTALRLHSGKLIRMIGNGTCKFWPTRDLNLKDCNRGDSIYGLDERGVLKQWYINSKIDDTTRVRRYEEWLSENNKHMSYGSTPMPYLGNYSIVPREITNPDHQENLILSIKSYFPNSSHENHNKLRPRDYSFKEWLKVKTEHTNVDKFMKNAVLNEWILDSFDVESNYSGMSNDPYLRDLEEYKSVFDNEIA
ncbi:hypothetical protein Tco_0335649 [Tanacetum coccineum]